MGNGTLQQCHFSVFFFSHEFFFHPWKKRRKCPWKFRTAREKTPKSGREKQKMPGKIFENSEFSTIFTGKTGEMLFPHLKQKSINPWKILRKCPWKIASGREKTLKSGRESFFLRVKKIKKMGKNGFHGHFWFLRGKKKTLISYKWHCNW